MISRSDKRATVLLERYINNGGDCSPAIKSAAQFWIYGKACWVLMRYNKEERRNRLETILEFHRPAVEVEATRLYKLRGRA